MRLLISILLFSAVSFGASTRNLEADTITNPGHTTTWNMPTVAGGIVSAAGMVQEVPSGTVNGANTSFTLSQTPSSANLVMVQLDGVYQQGGGTDYSISGTALTMIVAPGTGQKLIVVYSR